MITSFLNGFAGEKAKAREELRSQAEGVRAIAMQWIETYDFDLFQLPRLGETLETPNGFGLWTCVEDTDGRKVFELLGSPVGARVKFHDHPQDETLVIHTGLVKIDVKQNGHYETVMLSPNPRLGRKRITFKAGVVHRLEVLEPTTWQMIL